MRRTARELGTRQQALRHGSMATEGTDGIWADARYGKRAAAAPSCQPPTLRVILDLPLSHLKARCFRFAMNNPRFHPHSNTNEVNAQERALPCLMMLRMSCRDTLVSALSGARGTGLTAWPYTS